MNVVGENQPLGDEEFFHFCMANRDLKIERNVHGKIVIVPPVGAESDYRNVDLIAQLGNWAQRDGWGKAFGATVCFLLPDGAALSPDAAWVMTSKIAALEARVRKQFLPLVPDFVIEVMSPSDRVKPASAKMEQWIANGVSLGWLVDGDSRVLYVYRPGEPRQQYKGISQIEAGEPLSGFVVDLDDVWFGL